MAALALASCDPKPLVVQDTRELKSATLKVNNDNSTWNAGESRFFTVELAPDNAIITDIRLEQNIEGMVEIEHGERPDLFRVMARKAGRVKLTATVTDQNGITATDDLTFNITGNYLQADHSVQILFLNGQTQNQTTGKGIILRVGFNDFSLVNRTHHIA